MSEAFWHTVCGVDPTREANVETWLVLPLLRALGHDERNIDSKVPIYFQEGRTKQPGRKPEADFIVYSEQPFSRATSLITVETKRTDEALGEGRDQGESYAQNQRTPMLLMTNGVRLEVWQMQVTTESIRVFEADVSDLAARRSDLEALLSRESIMAHCASIEFKNFDLLARDLGPYERAMHDRSAPTARSSIARTLYDDTAKVALDWKELFLMPGALVVGPSGYGKTTLARSMVWEAIERRWEGKSSALPFDLFLPNLMPGQAIEDFLAARIAAHRPGFSPSMLAKAAREQGLLVIADGFERVKSERRSDIESKLHTLMHDYPQTQLIVLSRANAAPISLGLRLLKLQGYDHEHLQALAIKRATTHPNAMHAFSQAPDHVYRFGEVPLLADRLLDRFEAQRIHAPRIAPLFEQWLGTVLEASLPIDRALDRALLEKIAEQTASGPIGIDRAMELAAPRSDARQVLSRLAEADAISIRGAMVELQHEMLADYLRAARTWSLAESSGEAARLPNSFDSASLFAFLLIDTAPTAKDRASTWQAVARADIRLAIRSLRFATGDENFREATRDADAKRFLGDIAGSIETLTDTHLAPIANLLRAEIAGLPVERLGIQGSMNANNVGFSFFEGSGASESVRLGTFDRDGQAFKAYGHSLRHYGYGPEAGRIIGIDLLKEALGSLLKSRQLRGGPIWIEERVFGRMRHLAEQYHFRNDSGLLQDALDALSPQAACWVGGNAFQSGQVFVIQELCDDITWLIRRGITRIDPWWKNPASLDFHSHEGQQDFAHALNEYHRRRQLAYSEVVEESFPALAIYLPTLRMMPMRMEIQVEIHTRLGYERVVLHHRRWPVETFDQAGADVTFPEEPTYHRTDIAIQEYVSRTDDLLTRFGRSSPERIVTWGGSTIPDFLGNDTAFDGLPDESAVVRGAMAWLKNDLERMFAEIPRYPSK